MDSIFLKPIKMVNGTINLPGSKSISNRALLLSSFASGSTVLKNLLNSEDIYYMLNALKLLGIKYQLYNNFTCCNIVGNNGLLNNNMPIELFLGNSGTTVRLLIAALCLGKHNIIINCSLRMKHRPIIHLVESLRQGGAKIEFLEKEQYLPVRLYGGFTGGNIELDCSLSSQFLSALLITTPLAFKNTTINIKKKLVSKPYIDITLNMMKTFGVKVKNYSYKYFVINGKQKYKSPGEYLIEGDASSASYFLSAAAIKGGTVKVKGIGYKSIQGDTYVTNVLETMGSIIHRNKNFISCTKHKLNSIDMDMNNIPDVAMTIAIVSLFANGTTRLTNIYSWRFKETDRLFAMTNELRKLGAIVQEGKDYIIITPPKHLSFSEIEIDTYDDHRIAMCFSLIALSNVSVKILNPKCIDKTFPDYFKQFAKISIYI